jgi:Ala-tRNA(Pro) deacylase
MTAASVYDRLIALLAQHGATFDVLSHAPVFTSAQAAEVRGTSLASGAKALVCKADQASCLFVLPADRKLDSRLVRQQQRLRSLRFASPEEVLQITGLTPGAIPPFGSLFGLPTFCDVGLTAHATINFNAGDHCRSVCLRTADYLRIERPVLGQFAVREPPGS